MHTLLESAFLGKTHVLLYMMTKAVAHCLRRIINLCKFVCVSCLIPLLFSQKLAHVQIY